MQQALLTLSDLVIGYTGRTLSKPLNLVLPTGSNLGIIGSNGTGKTTLIKTILGIAPPLQGRFQWREGTHFGYVPQESQVDILVPLTLEDLLKMGLFPDLPRFRKKSRQIDELLQSTLEEMEVAPRKHSLIRNLSSGERQRALIARAWISRPQVLAMDEPFNFLDYPFKEKLWRIFSRWQESHELSVILIDHDLNRIINQVDYLVVLGPQGTICGPRAKVLDPEILSQMYGAPVHVHQEDSCFQVHFL